MSEDTDTTKPTKHPSGFLSQEACAKRQRSLFFIGLEMLGEKKKARFLSYLLSLQNPNQQNQEVTNEV
jgi:hypothetical protein